MKKSAVYLWIPAAVTFVPKASGLPGQRIALGPPGLLQRLCPAAVPRSPLLQSLMMSLGRQVRPAATPVAKLVQLLAVVAPARAGAAEHFHAQQNRLLRIVLQLSLLQ